MILQQPRLASLCFFCNRSYSSAGQWRPLKRLQHDHLETFRAEAFVPSKPALFPKKHFLGLPAAQKWFLGPHNTHDEARGTTLNRNYLDQFGNTIVPLEFTSYSNGANSFHRAEAPLTIFLQWASLAQTSGNDRLYLAQASFASLPKGMTDDLPTPGIVSDAGTGDIYDTNIWMGIPPTYTPLHRDPNPNLFVQLAGKKVVRILEPSAGDQVFARVQTALGKSARSAAFRGEEMMMGEEKTLLEAEIWDDASKADERGFGYSVDVEAGDGLFIPKGWWHSIKGVGGDITASVNWWFR